MNSSAPSFVFIVSLLFACNQGSDPEEPRGGKADGLGLADAGTAPDEEAACTAEAVATASAAEIASASGIPLESLDLPSELVVHQTQTLANAVSFDTAFAAALDSWLTDDSEIESALALMIDVEGVPPCPGPDGASQLRCYLAQPGSRLSLVGLDADANSDREVFPPEEGETVDEHWAFFMSLPTLSDHLFWAVVSRQPNDDGSLSVKNYGFN